MSFLAEVRNEFFEKTGQSRFKRIIVIAFFIAMIWCGVDFFVHDKLTFNLWHDLSVVIIAILLELCLPWGKQLKKQ